MTELKRYRIIETSTTCHCCFEFTIVDSQKVSEPPDSYNVHTYGYDFDNMAECFNREDAERICDALNAIESIKFGPVR